MTQNHYYSDLKASAESLLEEPLENASSKKIMQAIQTRLFELELLDDGPNEDYNSERARLQRLYSNMAAFDSQILSASPLLH